MRRAPGALPARVQRSHCARSPRSTGTRAGNPRRTNAPHALACRAARSCVRAPAATRTPTLSNRMSSRSPISFDGLSFVRARATVASSTAARWTERWRTGRRNARERDRHSGSRAAHLPPQRGGRDRAWATVLLSAAFSLKRGVDEGLASDEVAMINRLYVTSPEITSAGITTRSWVTTTK
jgi:hypothetical protein